MLPRDRLLAVAAHFAVVVGCCGVVAVIADPLTAIPTDSCLMVTSRRERVVPADHVGLVVPDSDLLVIAYFFFAVITYKRCVVMFDMNVLVLFSMDKHLLVP